MQDTQKREIIKKALEEANNDIVNALVKGERVEVMSIKDGIRATEIKRKEIKKIQVGGNEKC